MGIVGRSALALLVLANLPMAGFGQVLYGTLVGNVTDPQQGAVVGASVTINNKLTGYVVDQKTDERGTYDFRNLPPGTYDLKIAAAGFASFEAKELTVAANNIVRADAQLKVGSVADTITVGAEIAQLQTDRSSIQTDVGSKELTNIALGGYRNFQTVMDFMPGTTPALFQNASTDTPARALTTNVNGAARNSNNTRIDGAASVFTWLPHHAYYIPPLESIETVNVSTNSFDAEQGMSGGAAVSVITKSGTNQFRGVAFAYHLNHAWGAKNRFFNPNTPAGPGTPQRIDNQYGGTFGGPIVKDKLFFFTSWEGTTTAERGNGLLNVPTAQVRSGNFDGLATLFDPATGTPNGRGRTPFPGNRIPASRFSPQASTIQNLIPLPNTGTGQLANYFASVPYYFKRDMVDAKVNWTPNSRTNVFGKYSVMIAPVTAQAPLGEALGGYPGGAAGAAGIGTGNNKTDIFGGGVSYVITPTLLFDANFGGTLMHHDTAGPDYGRNIGTDVLRIPGTNGPDVRQSGFPIFNFNGYTSVGNTNNWSPVDRNDRSYTYVANINWTKGAHNIRAGLDFVQHQMNHWQPELGGWSPRGGFNFQSNAITGLNGTAGEGFDAVTAPAQNNFNSYAGFLMGMASSMGKAYQFYDPMRTREFHQGYYIRDNWQVNRKLSVNIGSRFEHFPIMNRGEFGIERYDPTTNRVIIGGRGNNPRNAGTEAQAIMFAPRIGFAYRFNEKTVIRAGYGITNDPYPVSRPIRSPYPAVIIDEYIPGNSWQAVTPTGVPVTLQGGIPAVRFPDITSGNITIPNTISTNSLQAGKFRRGYIQSVNFTIQRELLWGIVLQTSYVSTRSIRQTVTYFEANAGLVPGAGAAGRPLFNQFGVQTSRQFFIPMAHQRYDAWQTNITKRFSNGLFFTTNYTWSKALGINAGNSDNGLRFYVPSQFSANRSVADFDRTHTLTTAVNYELPFGKGKMLAKTGPAFYILGGWQVNPTFQFYSGLPFIVTADGGTLNAPQNTQVADQLRADVTKPRGVGLGNPFYDTTAFAAIPTARFGNMGLNALRGPRLMTSNLGIFRTFSFSERITLQFRGEALNVGNIPSLNNPNANVSNQANFMAITAASTGQSPQRTMRFGLRLGF